MAVFPATIADNLPAPWRWGRLCAWCRHPRQQSRCLAGVPAHTARMPPRARCSRTPADRCASIAPTDLAGARGSTRPPTKPFHGAPPWFSRWASSPPATACGERAATSRSRFRRSKRYGHAGAAHFFYPRPLLALPATDFPLVPLAGLPLRFLRRDPSLRQPLIDVARMEPHVKPATDQCRHPRRAPQLGGPAELRGRPGEPGKHFVLLLRRELGRAAGVRLGSQPPTPIFAVHRHPPRYGAAVYPEKIGNFLMRIARASAIDSQQPSPLQLG